MNVKVFVLGRPGSGKSTAARHINRHFKQYGWSTTHINDYDILKEMFLEDTDHRRFRPTNNNGFDAIDLTVMDIALREVETRVSTCFPQNDLVTIEFARDNYRKALQQFSPEFLRDAYIIFMDTDLDTCIQRVHSRVTNANSADDHPSFSDMIFRNYYREDNTSYMQFMVQQEFELRTAVSVINNKHSLESCIGHVMQCANDILKHERVQPPIAV